MFDLVGKRYLFILISLLVIVPGVLSLIFKGLNVGIDFLGGTNAEFRPGKSVSITEMRNLVKPFNFVDLQVVTGDNPQLPAAQTVWIRLNTRIDSNVRSAIESDLKAKYGPQLAFNIDNLSLVPSTGGKASTVTVLTVTKFAQGVTPAISDIKTVLSKLPDTSDPTKGPSTSSPTPTATATTTGTPNATATPKPSPTATGTASILVTPTATPVSTSNPSNIPVNVVAVSQGTTTETISLLTRSVIDPPTLLKLQSTFINNGIYLQVLDNASVTGSVASETTRNAFLAVLAASVLILLYIWFAFRKVDKPWRYGTCAIIALLHDVLVVLGVFECQPGANDGPFAQYVAHCNLYLDRTHALWWHNHPRIHIGIAGWHR